MSFANVPADFCVVSEAQNASISTGWPVTPESYDLALTLMSSEEYALKDRRTIIDPSPEFNDTSVAAFFELQAIPILTVFRAASSGDKLEPSSSTSTSVSCLRVIALGRNGTGYEQLSVAAGLEGRTFLGLAVSFATAVVFALW